MAQVQRGGQSEGAVFSAGPSTVCRPTLFGMLSPQTGLTGSFRCWARVECEGIDESRAVR